MISDTRLDSVIVRVSVSNESTTWLTIDSIDRRVMGFEFVHNITDDGSWALFSVGVTFAVSGLREARLEQGRPGWDRRFLLPELAPGWVLELAAHYAPTKVI